MHKLGCLIAALALYGSAHAGVVSRERVTPAAPCAANGTLLVTRGADLAALIGVPLRQLSLMRYADGKLAPISFQIDQKDSEQRYRFHSSGTRVGAAPGERFDGNDELVLMRADSGERLPDADPAADSMQLVEIETRVPGSTGPAWVYARIDTPRHAAPVAQPVRYLPDLDLVQSELYRIGFARRSPFLIESFHWRHEPPAGWSPNVVDIMKIRHQGKLLGFLPFVRTHNDYSSALLAVKQGPLRIIRRTENRVRIVWKLKSPALYIDYVMMPDGFIMDTVVDIPFNVGLFFDAVETFTTMDWNDDPALPALSVSAPAGGSGLRVDGRMSAEETLFNSVRGERFSVDSAFGSLNVHLDLPEGFPVEAWLYLRDAVTDPDPPERHAGQFGNVGFRTTQWERVDTEVHHLKFTVCMASER